MIGAQFREMPFKDILDVLGEIGKILKLTKKYDFALYGSWEGLVGSKILLRGVGTICPPGEHMSEKKTCV